ncbi:MAG TPA: hypothetical protein VG269_01800 [Tepidisphaeraceae bacterium]|jgi:hypothetical protein|nr:hypothetical protein [Tepidisphaeraceae bacterium]
MNAVRIRKHLESQVLDLPEIAGMVGKTVEIIVLEDQQSATAAERGAWNSPTIGEQAAAQGTRPVQEFNSIVGGWPENQLNDGFETALDERRRQEIVAPIGDE